MEQEAPKKIYLQEPTKVRTEKKYDNDVEYIRTDAFIEKAKEFIWTHTEGSDYHVNYVLKNLKNI